MLPAHPPPSTPLLGRMLSPGLTSLSLSLWSPFQCLCGECSPAGLTCELGAHVSIASKLLNSLREGACLTCPWVASLHAMTGLCIKHLLCARPWVKCFVFSILNPHKDLWTSFSYPHFSEENWDSWNQQISESKRTLRKPQLLAPHTSRLFRAASRINTTQVSTDNSKAI